MVAAAEKLRAEYESGIVPNVVEVHVSRLRGKLGRHAWLVETVRGVGYRLVSERGP